MHVNEFSTELANSPFNHSGVLTEEVGFGMCNRPLPSSGQRFTLSGRREALR
jgi:hypothetical protein